jgi:thioredoxin-like negative regulator of GroEL
MTHNHFLKALRLCKIFIFLCYLAPCFSLGSGPTRSQQALSHKVSGGTFRATLKNGYHFNEKAPNGLQVGQNFYKPTEFSSRSMKIEKWPRNGKPAAAHLYVCDDAVTFCDRHVIPLKFEIQADSVENSSPSPNSSSNAASRKIKTASLAITHGFIQNNFDEAVRKAKKEGKLLLVDFGARWCPACLRLESEIFKNSDFQKLTKKFVKVKIDVDLLEHHGLEQKYAIKGIPSVLILNSKAQEIARFYDYQPLEFIKEFVEDIRAQSTPLEDLSPDLDRRLLIRRYYFSGHHDKVVTLSESLPVRPKEYWFSKIALAEEQTKSEPSKVKELIGLLKEAIAQEPESSRSLVWRLSLVQELKSDQEKKKVAEEAFEATKKLLADPKTFPKATNSDFLGEYTGLEGFYIAMMNAEVAEVAQSRQKESWNWVIEQGRLYQVGSEKPGASLRLLSALIRSEKMTEALQLVNEMLVRDPDSGDLQRRKLKILNSLNQFAQAVEVGEKALKNSYGANEFQVVEPLARAYQGYNQTEKARQLVTSYLGRSEIKAEEFKSLKNRLEKMRQEFQ